MKKFTAMGVCILLSGSPSMAGFQEWSSEKEADPFSGGEKVSATFMSSIRSGVVILCDTAEPGLTVRAIPGFDYDESLAGFTPTIKFAFDGKLLFEAEGMNGKVGNNLAISQVHLDGPKAKDFVDAFAKSKKQIAISDGIGDKPHLLTAKGSTATGAAIVGCIDKQAGL